MNKAMISVEEPIDDISTKQWDIIETISNNKDGIKVVIAGFICNFMTFGIGFSYGVFQEFYTSQDGPLKHYSDSEVAIIGTLGTALTYLCGIFNKSIMYYLKPRNIMLIGSVLMSLGLIMTGFCTELYQFILSQGLLFGVGSSLLYLPPVVCAPFYFNRHRAIAMGILFSGTGFGGLAMANISRYLIGVIGWQWCVRILGFMNLILTIIASFLVVEPKVNNFRTNNKLFNFRQLGSWKVFLVIFGGLLQSAGYLIPLIYMSKYARTLNFSYNQGALFIGLNNAINACFKILLGYVGDRVGRMNTIITCSVLSAVTIFALWMVNARDAYISFVVFYGVFSGVIISLLPTCLVELFGVVNYQSMSGLMYFSRGVGSMLGSPLAGLMIANQGLHASDYKNPIIYNGVLLLSSAVCLVAVRLIVASEGGKLSWKF
jgi:MFS family permease